MMDTLNIDNDLDDDLLVPFGRRKEQILEGNNGGNTIFSPRKSVLGKLLRRPDRNHNSSQDRNSLLGTLDMDRNITGVSQRGAFTDEPQPAFKGGLNRSMATSIDSTTVSVKQIKNKNDKPDDSPMIFNDIKKMNEADCDEDESEDESEEDESEDESAIAVEGDSVKVVSPPTSLPLNKPHAPLSTWNHDVYKDSKPNQWSKNDFVSDCLDDHIGMSLSKRENLLGRLWAGSFRNQRSQDTSSLLDAFSTENGGSENRVFRDEQKDSAWRHSDRKTTTFAFPNVPVEQAELIDDHFDSSSKFKNESRKDTNIMNEGGESDEEESRANRPNPESIGEHPTDSQRETWNFEAYDEPKPRKWRKEGFGSDPGQDERKGVFGTVWRHFGRNKAEPLSAHEKREMERRMVQEEQKSLRTMKVATDDTKHDKTLTETLTKVALVVLLPELYAEIDDGDENLGMYRTISSTADEDVYETNPEMKLQQEVYALQNKIKDLEKSLKSAELEANSWKLRSKELEAELTKYRGGDSSDESSDEVDEDSDDDCIEDIKENHDIGSVCVPATRSPSSDSALLDFRYSHPLPANANYTAKLPNLTMRVADLNSCNEPLPPIEGVVNKLDQSSVSPMEGDHSLMSLNVTTASFQSLMPAVNAHSTTCNPLAAFDPMVNTFTSNNDEWQAPASSKWPPLSDVICPSADASLPEIVSPQASTPSPMLMNALPSTLSTKSLALPYDVDDTRDIEKTDELPGLVSESSMWPRPTHLTVVHPLPQVVLPQAGTPPTMPLGMPPPVPMEALPCASSTSVLASPHDGAITICNNDIVGSSGPISASESSKWSYPDEVPLPPVDSLPEIVSPPASSPPSSTLDIPPPLPLDALSPTLPTGPLAPTLDVSITNDHEDNTLSMGPVAESDSVKSQLHAHGSFSAADSLPEIHSPLASTPRPMPLELPPPVPADELASILPAGPFAPPHDIAVNCSNNQIESLSGPVSESETSQGSHPGEVANSSTDAVHESFEPPSSGHPSMSIAELQIEPQAARQFSADSKSIEESFDAVPES